MPRPNLGTFIERKLKKWFSMTLDLTGDGVVNWDDFENAVERIVSAEDAKRNARLKILRKRIEQNYQKYFWDLCAAGDANNDGNVDLDEWLDVMDGIVGKLKETNEFPEWFEGLHKALWRSVEFLEERNVQSNEFAEMMAIWNVQSNYAEKAFDFITENGAKKMDYALFSDLMKKYFKCETPGHPLNLGCQ
jgi:Ca2+-binding EF-hand superfamily protein